MDAASAGIGLRQPHYRAFRAARPPLGFVEVHSENFFNPHDAAARVLEDVRARYPVSLHGVGLALGSACGLDAAHLERLAALVERIEPARVSDHACFARAPGPGGATVHANDLLPVAFTRGSLEVFCDNVDRVQERLGRRVLVENLSSYLDFAERDYGEPEFFAELGRRTGCGLLLDVNNLMVNALNAGAADPLQAVHGWLEALARTAPPALVGEIHLAGHGAQQGLVIDDHSSPVSAPVWNAYAHALALFGPIPTLVEWDERLPALEVLLGEAARAQACLDAQAGRASPDARAGGARAAGGAMNRATGAREREGLRQRVFLEALFAPRPAPEPPPALGVVQRGAQWARGLAAYRENGLAHARAALRAQFPTVLAMLGATAFDAVCAAFWRDSPPRRGDLAWVGEGFPAHLAARADLAAWPWLADSARLDLALWQVMFERDAALAEADLRRLAGTDPARLRLALAPGLRRVASRWAVVSLWTVHREPEPADSALRAAACAPAEVAWVWREGLEARCMALSAAEARWVEALGASPDLQAALDAAPEALDLDAWLRAAVRHGWLDRVIALDEPGAPVPAGAQR